MTSQNLATMGLSQKWVSWCQCNACFERGAPIWLLHYNKLVISWMKYATRCRKSKRTWPIWRWTIWRWTILRMLFRKYARIVWPKTVAGPQKRSSCKMSTIRICTADKMGGVFKWLEPENFIGGCTLNMRRGELLRVRLKVKAMWRTDQTIARTQMQLDRTGTWTSSQNKKKTLAGGWKANSWRF